MSREFSFTYLKIKISRQYFTILLRILHFQMSCFTRTGLLPSLITSHCDGHQQKILQLDMNGVIVPAPTIIRPTMQNTIYNYPPSNSCSIFCNHPITDVNAKKLLKKTKGALKKQKQVCQSVKMNFNFLDFASSNDFNLEDKDQILVPEILFRRYTQTDSRPPTPTFIVSPSINSFNICHRQSITQTYSRRCITPDDDQLLNFPQKKRLIVNLRRSLSQNSLTLEGIRIRKNYIPGSILGSEYIQNEFSNKFKQSDIEKHLPAKSKVKKIPVSSTITKHQNFSKQKFREHNDIDNSITRVDYMSLNIKPHVHPRELKKKKKKTTAKIVLKKNRKREEDVIKNFDDTETQVSRNTNYNEEINVERRENREVDISCNYDLHYDDIHEILVKNNSESILNELDPQKNCSSMNIVMTPRTLDCTNHILDLESKYGLGLNIVDRSMQHNNSLNHTQIKLDVKSLEGGQVELLRTLSRRNARFELPLDKNNLIGMKPSEYLMSFVYISDASRIAYDKIFHLFTSRQDQKGFNDNIDVHLSSTIDLMAALAQTMGKNFSEDEAKIITELLDFQNSNQCTINLETWRGINAFCERIFASKLSFKHLSKADDPCDEIEEADFEFLERKLFNITIEENLKTILFLIRNS